MSHRLRIQLLLVAALVSGAVPLVLASAATAAIGPDSFGYRAITSAETYGPHAGPFTSIAATGVDIGNHCDDCSTAVTTPFPINLYDRNGATAFASLNVSSNGNVQGVSANTAFVNTTLPNAGMNYLVAPYWDDLRTDQPGNAIWTSTAGVAPNRTFTVEWKAKRVDTAAVENFQLVLTEGSADIEARYLAVPTQGGSATIGIQQGVSGSALQYSMNTASVANSLAIRFTPGPDIAIGNVSAIEGDVGSSSALFTVSLKAPSTYPVTVKYATREIGSAAPGSDYVTTSGTLTFAPGEVWKSAPVAIRGDLVYEPLEQFVVDLSEAKGGIVSAGLGTGSIQNDDGFYSLLSPSGATVSEGDVGSRSIFVGVSLSAPAPSTVDAHYRTASFDPCATCATEGIDYVAKSGDLTFSPGQQSKTVSIVIKGDKAVEADEQFLLIIDPPSGANSAGSSVITIRNDDTGAVPGPTLSVGDAWPTEPDTGTGLATFTVTLSTASADAVTVEYHTEDGNAVAPSDYTAVPLTTLTVPAGARSAAVSVHIRGDKYVEGLESFTLKLTDPTNATIGVDSGTAAISETDQPPTVSAGSAQVVEGNVKSRLARFTVRLSAPSASVVTVHYQTGDGGACPTDCAVAGTDYTATSGTLTFGAGQVSSIVSVMVKTDQTFEVDEWFGLHLDSPTGATLGLPDGTGRILDDDE